jgi:hypothetical protein
LSPIVGTGRIMPSSEVGLYSATPRGCCMNRGRVA